MIITMLAMFAVQSVPGAQQEPQGIDYTIEGRLDEASDVLSARLRLRYENNSAEALDTLWFHQHLNAFRPNSAWATRELQFETTRFQELGARDHAFERLTRVEVDGRPVRAVYPGSPDSTVFALPLSAPLRAGGTVTVDIDWDARASTLPRRQGRRGRHFDWAQWYPRIAAYTEEGWQVQPLLPQGEFFGEFGTYDVTLDVPEDQVLAATGVPISGDPGWEAAARDARQAIDYQREAYGTVNREPLGLVGDASAGRKVVRWRAEDVHHFAWSADPEFVYESGSLPRSAPGSGEIAVHVLYWPSDDDWHDVALARSIRSIEWLQDRFGPYPWPQFTNLHRIESGGTEFPMLIMDGSPSEGLIMHEAGHQYAHGIFGNNEFREGWLDEGFSSYLTDTYWQEQGVSDIWDRTLQGIRDVEVTGRSQPIGLAGADFVDPPTYSLMTYSKAELVFRMLEWLVGSPTMRDALRIFYDQNALQHVTEADFRSAVEEASGRDLGWFFEQWIHTTDQLDYGVASATTAELVDGSWATSIEIERSGAAWMPVTLRVGTQETLLESRDRMQTVTVHTDERPDFATVDPDNYLLDIDIANNGLTVTEQ